MNLFHNLAGADGLTEVFMKAIEVKLKDIIVYDNTRISDSKNIADLMKSINNNGLLNPIVIANNFTQRRGKYILCSGHRRFKAMTNLGLITTRATLDDRIEDESALMISNLVENIDREEISPFEEARYFNKLKIDYNMTNKQIGIRVGKSEGYVAQTLRSTSDIPKRFRTKIVRGGPGKKVELGQIRLATASKVITAKKNDYINQSALNRILSENSRKILSDNEAVKIAKNYDKKKPYATNVEEILTAESSERGQTRVTVLFNTKHVAKLCKKYNMSAQGLFQAILYGEIKESIKRS